MPTHPKLHDDAKGIAIRFVELASEYTCSVESENGKKLRFSEALQNQRFARALVASAAGWLGMSGGKQAADKAESLGTGRFTSPMLLALDFSVENASRQNATISLAELEESARKLLQHVPGGAAPDSIALAIVVEAARIAPEHSQGSTKDIN